MVAFVLALPGVGGQGCIVQAGSIEALLGREDAGLGRVTGAVLVQAALFQQGLDAGGVGGDRVVRLTIGFGGQLRRAGQLPDGVGEVVAVQAGGREHDVHARAAQLLARHELHVDDAAAFIPDGFHAHQPQGLGFQQALVAHGFHRP